MGDQSHRNAPCEYCGGSVEPDDAHVYLGPVVYHRGCARDLCDDLNEALRDD